jgi:hypothetical protein
MSLHVAWAGVVSLLEGWLGRHLHAITRLMALLDGDTWTISVMSLHVAWAGIVWSGEGAAGEQHKC